MSTKVNEGCLLSLSLSLKCSLLDGFVYWYSVHCLLINFAIHRISYISYRREVRIQQDVIYTHISLDWKEEKSEEKY